jgi:hypothetical protein
MKKSELGNHSVLEGNSGLRDEKFSRYKKSSSKMHSCAFTRFSPEPQGGVAKEQDFIKNSSFQRQRDKHLG